MTKHEGAVSFQDCETKGEFNILLQLIVLLLVLLFIFDVQGFQMAPEHTHSI